MSESKWTKEKPTTSGYYWCKYTVFDSAEDTIVVRVFEAYDGLRVQSFGFRDGTPIRKWTAGMTAEWQGPIEPEA
jgi:hypothetical protein